MHSPTSVVILNWQTPATYDHRAHEIGTFLGAEPAEVSLSGAVLVDGASIGRCVPRSACLIANVETLAKAVDAMPAGLDGLRNLTSFADHVFVYGFQPSDRHNEILRALSSGGLRGVEAAPDGAKFHVSRGHDELCRQFSGLDVPGVDSSRDWCFVEAETVADQVAFVRAADQPFFIRVNYCESAVYLLACAELANLNEAISPDAGLLPWFSRLIPFMIFLRAALKDRLWHSERSQACFIIDDPLLRRKYGFLEYAKLLETMGSQKFSMCIAFIPWNYRRSSKKIAAMFSSGSSSLSVCVHGCDHTRAEFASTDFDLLRGKAQLALNRMEAHQESFGLLFDDVMVFPQGLFSLQALRALEACGYLAAINTTVCPLDLPKELPLRDFLEVAVTSFEGVPLFSRHYPKDVAEFAFDLFVGKPAFVVEHHGYFRNGYAELAEFAKQLNGLDDKLKWNDPGTICSRACLQRLTPEGDVEVRFFSGRLSLRNDTGKPQKYLVSNRRTLRATDRVTVNGRPWVQERKDDHLSIGLTLNAGERADIKIVSGRYGADMNVSWKPSNGHNARVLIRRVLSEVRDDCVETSAFLGGILSSAKKLRAQGRAKA